MIAAWGSPLNKACSALWMRAPGKGVGVGSGVGVIVGVGVGAGVWVYVGRCVGINSSGDAMRREQERDVSRAPNRRNNPRRVVAFLLKVRRLIVETITQAGAGVNAAPIV